MVGLFLALVILLSPCPCPANTTQVAKWECSQNIWSLAEGSRVEVTGNCQLAFWSSQVELAAVMAKGGQICYAYPGGTTGTISADDTEGYDLSHVSFCEPKPTVVRLARFFSTSLAIEIGWLKLLVMAFVAGASGALVLVALLITAMRLLGRRWNI